LLRLLGREIAIIKIN